MNKKILTRSFFALAILLGGWLFYAVVPGAPEPSPRLVVTNLPKEESPSPLNFTGLTFSTYQGKELQSRVRIQEMRAAPRKLYIFRVRTINELLLFNVEAEIFQNDKKKPIDLLPIAELQDRVSGAMLVKGMGRITQGHILGFTAIVKANHQETLRVTAREATIDFSKDKIVMLHATLIQPAAQCIISSNRIDWDSAQRRFIIPGEFRERRGEKVSKGTAVIADTNLIMVKIVQDKKDRN